MLLVDPIHFGELNRVGVAMEAEKHVFSLKVSIELNREQL